MTGFAALNLARGPGTNFIIAFGSTTAGPGVITVPAGAGFFTAEAIGCGGNGFGSTTAAQRAGGGGGIYARSDFKISVLPGTQLYNAVGTFGGPPFDSWVNAAANAAPTASSTGTLAKQGTSAASGVAGVGNQAGSIGSVINVGGSGAVNTGARGGGGGGASGAGSSFTAGTDTTGIMPGLLMGGGTGGVATGGSGTAPGGGGGSNTTAGSSFGGSGRVRVAFYGPGLLSGSIFYRSVASTAYASRTDTTISAPAGIADGDILIAVIHTTLNPAAPTPAAAAGWTVFGTETSVTDGTGLNGRLNIYWKRAASESGSYTFTHATASSTGYIAAYIGCLASGTPLGATSNNTGTGSGAASIGTSITTTANSSYLLYVAHNWQGSAASPAAGMTERFDTRAYLADQLCAAAAGPTGSRNPILNGNGVGTDMWAVRMVELLTANPVTAPSEHIITSYAPLVADDRNDFDGEVGWTFQLPTSTSRSISWLGVRVFTGNTGLHTVRLYDGTSLALLATASIDVTGKTVGTFAWGLIPQVTLVSGVTYVVVIPTTPGGQFWGGETLMTTQSVVNTVASAYRGFGGGPFSTVTADAQFGGVDLGW